MSMETPLIQALVAAAYSRIEAEDIAGIIFDVLREPDRDMLDAGLAELNLAMGPVTDRIYRRDLVRVMLDRAR